ncbi:class I SAM-dependent methyltransferase [Mesorhizobium sp. 1B3]|uniref:class I SAM-dependent methyltransferase n=1 Tax=Mesorhizobium sp. 1B3 TaxID=3243599 RepID=UPI003D99F261
MSALESSAHASLMNGVYRYQRHIYDLTRKYYLLGRDRMIAFIEPASGAVLELGCGTGRNIVLAARRYPEARFFGLDISSAMLDTAAFAITREGIASRVKLAQGDATSFDLGELFGSRAVDRVFISYSLSMIPQWEDTIAAALTAIKPGGSLHIVDFGPQEHLPRWFKRVLRAWLASFHVSPRDSLREVLESTCQHRGASLSFETLYRGYAVHAVVTLPTT